ncbi:MAG: bifunctional DNA primase/polymerase [Planctomycetes bacterium]|nr:bifunctional DNA primase/polymerase [Planctomycetota bacterium]
MSECTIIDTALRYADFGMCILPLRPRSKKPAVAWVRYQRTRPTQAQVVAWFRNNDRGIAVVLGAVSGGLCCRDFDVEEGYRHWAGANTALAKVLPTVRSARGHHVYFRSERKSIEVLEDGELRGNGITVLPPTRHKSGHVYRWQVDLPGAVEDVPFLDPVEVGLIHRSDTEQTEHTEHTEPLGWGEKGWSLEQIITSTLPGGPGQRNRCIFKLARCLRGHEDFKDADWPALRLVLQDWYRRALPMIESKDFIETEADFLHAWSRVRSPMGMDYLAMIRERAMLAQPLELAQRWGMEGFGFLIQLCHELQLDAGDGAFFLSTRDAGRLLNIKHSTASRMLVVLRDHKILEVVKQGQAGGRRATRFRFLGETEDEANSQPSTSDREV